MAMDESKWLAEREPQWMIMAIETIGRVHPHRGVRRRQIATGCMWLVRRLISGTLLRFAIDEAQWKSLSGSPTGWRTRRN